MCWSDSGHNSYHGGAEAHLLSEWDCSYLLWKSFRKCLLCANRWEKISDCDCSVDFSIEGNYFGQLHGCGLTTHCMVIAVSAKYDLHPLRNLRVLNNWMENSDNVLTLSSPVPGHVQRRNSQNPFKNPKFRKNILIGGLVQHHRYTYQVLSLPPFDPVVKLMRT